jgi:FKBP-type peptidyl-prolyl cis-trans isomerase
MKTPVLHRATLLTLCATAALSPLCRAQDMAQQNVPAPTTGAATTGAPATNPVGDKLELRLRLKEGQAYTLRNISEQKITQTINGQPMNVLQVIGFDMRYDVLKVDEAGNMTTKTTFTGATFMMNGPMGNIEYDSTQAEAKVPEPLKGIAAMLGQSFQVTMSPRGRVLDMQGAEAMLQSVMEKIDIPDKNMRAMMQDQMKAQFSAENLRKMTESGSAFYPEKPVAIGESWGGVAGIAPGLGINTTNSWTLKERRDGIAIITASTTLEAPATTAPVQMGNMTVQNEMSGSGTGTMEVDEATGWVRESEVKMVVSGKVTTATQRPAPQTPLTMVSPIKVESRTRLMSYPTTGPAPAFLDRPAAATNTTTTNPTTKGKTMTQDNGLIIEDLVEGTGAEAKAGQKVTVHYRGTLTDGREFDASYNRNEPFTFSLGAGQVIQGWDQGVAGMKEGGKRKLTIPPALGYGARGAGGVIPPNATLVFEVELLKAQ